MTRLAAVLLGLAVIAGGLRAVSHSATGATYPRVTAGATSLQALVNDLVAALQTRDEDALRRLRLTEGEYRDIVLPGSVPPGQPPRELTPTWKDYAWANLETRSFHHARRLLAEFGGRALRPTDVTFENGEQRYAGYTAYRQLRLTLTDATGETHELRTGSVAEIDGRYKFISFIRD